MSLVTGSSSLPSYASPSSMNGSAASTKLAVPMASASSTSSPSTPNAGGKTDEPTASTTVTLSSQGLNMSHAAPPAPAPSGAAAAPAAAPDSPSIYDDVKGGIVGAIEDVGDAIGGTARFIGDSVADVVSGADALVHGVVDLPFALGAEACNAAGAVLDAL